jgi:hypothetical protein
MAVNINTAYQYLYTQANKDFGGQFTVDQFNLAFNQVETSLFWNFIGYDTASQGNQYRNNNFASATQVDTESLLPFFVYNQLINPLNGIATLPSDYAYINNLMVEYIESGVSKFKEVEQIAQGTEAWILNSSLLNPTQEYPKFLFLSETTLKVMPATNAVYLSYWRVPTPARWSFTTVNGRPVYDPLTSVDSEFNEKDSNTLVSMVGKILGINLKDSNFVQFANAQIQQGQ